MNSPCIHFIELFKDLKMSGSEAFFNNIYRPLGQVCRDLKSKSVGIELNGERFFRWLDKVLTVHFTSVWISSAYLFKNGVGFARDPIVLYFYRRNSY